MSATHEAGQRILLPKIHLIRARRIPELDVEKWLHDVIKQDRYDSMSGNNETGKDIYNSNTNPNSFSRYSRMGPVSIGTYSISLTNFLP